MQLPAASVCDLSSAVVSKHAGQKPLGISSSTDDPQVSQILCCVSISILGCHSDPAVAGEESRTISSVSQGQSQNFGCCSQSSLRSSHRGFICSKSAIF